MELDFNHVGRLKNLKSLKLLLGTSAESYADFLRVISAINISLEFLSLQKTIYQLDIDTMGSSAKSSNCRI